MIRATLEFELPENHEEYTRAIQGQDYYSAIGEIIEWLKRKMDSEQDDRYYAYEATYLKIFQLANSRGLSPWGDK